MSRENIYLTSPQAARLAGVSRPTMWRWFDVKKFGQPKRAAGSSRLRVSVASIEQALGTTYTDSQVADAAAFRSSSKPRGVPTVVYMTITDPASVPPAVVTQIEEARDTQWRLWLISKKQRALHPSGPLKVWHRYHPQETPNV